MAKLYKDITGNIASSMKALQRDIPDVMSGFHAMSKAATSEGALTTKEKEYIALAIGVAGHCDGCIGFHTKALVREGVTREEFTEVLGVAVYMGGGPSLMYAAEALQAFEEYSEE